MKNVLKTVFAVAFVFMISVSVVACGGAKKPAGETTAIAEKVELTKCTLGEVEFENSEATKLKQTDETVVVSGTIDAMSASQKSAYGVDEVTHVAVLKFVFDKERTVSSFEIKGGVSKVYGGEETAENYSGALSDLLDNKEGEDAYTNLVLSANTKEYTLKTVYTDDTETTIKVKIEATLATAVAE